MTDVQPIFFNPLEDGYVENPWGHFDDLRRLEPVHHSPIGQWFLFGYDDVSTLLRDPNQSVDDANIAHHNQDRLAQIEAAYGPDAERSTSMLGRDAPDHTRLRRLVSKAFTPAAIAALRPVIEELVDDSLDEMEQRGTTEIVHDLAFPLPFDVISVMLGMPEADKDQIAEWSSAVVKTLDPIISDEEVFAAADAGRKMEALLAEVIEWKRANPADDLLTALIQAEEDGDRLSPKELRDQVQLLFIAGHETTVNLIGTGIYELLRNPQQASLLRDDPALDVNAVDELLRFVSPVQFSRRITMAPIEIGGHAIDTGSVVMTGLASANHDPAKWGDDADEIDVRRTGTAQHVAFGSGSHYCLGSSLARLEAQVAIGRFLRRFPDARIDGDAVWNGRINLRGIERLDIAVR
ncbi:cytochrome P450 [Ilumatobacter nonamiensis]|uniref:cytochrome P450 n=1 Tax=Ilumatobacter nonamiensis TaxID=467093 RepID=UPI000349EC1D|nr:cytochrome P450 [Ilumatobacter nonamiensis]